jgi:hypothetical protein
VPALLTNTITPRRAIKNYQLNSLINLRYVALALYPGSLEPNAAKLEA